MADAQSNSSYPVHGPRSTVHARWSTIHALVLLALAVIARQAPVWAGDVPRPVPAPVELDDPAEKLAAAVRNDEEADRLEAVALYGAGRMKEQRGDAADALRAYQRAARYDPSALPIVQDVVRLAFTLKRTDEAVRYALKGIDLGAPANPSGLRDLGMSLAQEGDLAGALKLYKKAIELHGDPESVAHILLVMEAGKIYFLNEQPAEAADCFGQVIAALENPEKFELDGRVTAAILGKAEKTYDLFGEAFLAAGRLDEAQSAFERSHELAANAGLLAYRQARILQGRGQSEAAMEKLEGYFAAPATEQGTAPYELLSRLLTGLNRAGELISQLERVRALDPENPALSHFLAEQYRLAGMLDLAEKLFSELSEKSPTVETYQGLAGIYRQGRRVEPLLRVLGEVAAKTGGLDDLRDEVQALAADTALLDELLSGTRERHKTDPDNLGYGARLATAIVALEAKRYDAADEFFELALKVQRENGGQLVLIWGQKLFLAEQYASAARLFQKAIDDRVAPDQTATLYYFLSGALALDDRFEEALAAARSAAEMKPGVPAMESRIPWILYYAKRHDEAAAAYAELIARYDPIYPAEADGTSPPDDVRRVVRESRLVLSGIYVLQNKLSQSEEILEQVLDEFPDDVSALNDLGYLWADQGKRLARAEAMISKAVAAEPDNVAYRDSLGWVYFRLGRFDAAVAELERATAGTDPDAVILDHLGDVYQAAGRADAARQAWEKAALKFDEQKEAEKAAATRRKFEAQPPSDPSP